MIEKVLKAFEMNIFKPEIDHPKTLPDSQGIYLITANSINCLPEEMRSLQYNFIHKRPIIYIGIAGRSTSKRKSLRERDYRNHFNGNARGSTLRKSLGSIMNLSRKYSSNNPTGSKYKFIKSDEEFLSKWMKANLYLHYFVTSIPMEIEKEMINLLNPPLNLKDNNNLLNQEFRKDLSHLRSKMTLT